MTPSTKTTWIIEPIDPLIFGQGKPNTAVPGSANVSRALPPPQALAGAVRTRWGLNSKGVFTETPERARAWQVHGPLVAALGGATGAVTDWLFPRPTDAQLRATGEEGDPVVLKRLVPLRVQPGDWVGGPEELSPVGLPGQDRAKPHPDPPPLWSWADIEPWLRAPALPRELKLPKRIDELASERRVHVSLDSNDVARAGFLFSSEGRRWHSLGHTERRLALAVLTDAPLKPGPGALGGKRRLAEWRPHTGEPFPQAPRWLFDHLEHSDAVRVLLITPAIFPGGSDPRAPDGRMFGAPAGSKLIAQASDRPDVISGWDLEKNLAKGTRRLVPAGAVFFLHLGGTPEERRDWASQTWGAPVSPDLQDQRDGFGLALIGAWDGALFPLLPEVTP